MSMDLSKVIQTKSIIKFGLAALWIGAILGTTLPSKAETPDTFTRHGLPLPGAYFKNKGSQQPATIAVSKSGKGVGEQKQTLSKIGKKRTQSVRSTKKHS
jgi:hypothetical protein